MGKLFREAEDQILSAKFFGENWREFKNIILAIADDLGGASNITVTELIESTVFSLVESMIDEMAR